MTDNTHPMTNPSPKISIVLPTFNEAGNIEPLIDRTLHALGDYPGGLEVVVVDDNSPDGTWQLVAAKAKTDPRVRLIGLVWPKDWLRALAWLSAPAMCRAAAT
jgi:dolichol-phosphate mannosyltransferase